MNDTTNRIFSFDDMTALMLIEYLHLPSVSNQNSDEREVSIRLGKGVSYTAAKAVTYLDINVFIYRKRKLNSCPFTLKAYN